MVKLTTALLVALGVTGASATNGFVKRQASSSSRHHTRTSTATLSATAAAPTSTFTGSLPASVLSIVTTISSGEGNPTATVALATTFSAGAQNAQITNAPKLPSLSTVLPANFPALDQVPPIDSPQAKAWISAIDFSKVPSVGQTVDGASCASNPTNLANAGADKNCWWSCGGCTRDTDITTCPDKNTWGLSYDDGPSPYTPQLLDYLDEHNLKSTFFVVGSRAISRPDMLQTEYMSGHQISVHTWSHPALTTLTNEQIVVELAWTREVIRQITGVTPNTMRPPYGDIDDRVRAICAQMNLTPIIWTSTSPSENYDTNDWKIGAGTVSAAEVVYNFEQILANASKLPTGYIVLAHDLYQQSVELATEVVLPAALSMSPKQNILPIIECLNKPLGDAYVETNRNISGSQPTATASGSASVKPTSSSSTSSSAGSSSGASGASSVPLKVPALLLGSAFLGALALL
ncbi:glycoside hydrolase/deacetylase [Violaceomyces palustris]|uniref:Glycoside hydrolase/deacetylase n=1 Tax=Violaceomyces palustris TaxID=1673888 RepID=A0ACD0NWT1_9BASI|nr:glycoside hydrolase/deacetylase [Violaceomyces palustris]